ncbi:hypothetical protein TBLA_0E04240 [Henningerozyma blattae CBS 6284]|uniref:RNA helicase n=1 Tax=Henningerozyma blattae (strain ATCC 34711 / CBS 6284 / DSM 70876 / NBRC 10599 / NRRL Y-10934 / UCD 77-7) TaxID=1071380 RepID=I2H526_HENB6|nr:hypothetical protein TBLA_0E04240 [Tetrapisispora blattae CBS 6284]CCH61478.1 hypothetical protein TBLA_0E04240 [Tetrapisispora blattae CBS 6284]
MDEDARQKKDKVRELYRHDKMSNQVLQTDKRFHSNNSNAILDAEKSQPKSMAGRISIHEMGKDARLQESDDEKERIRENAARLEAKKSEVEQQKLEFSSHSTKNTLLNTDTSESLHYYPSTQANKQIYQDALTFIENNFGTDLPRDIIISILDTLIFSIKTDKESKPDKIERLKEEFQEALMLDIDNKNFQSLVEIVEDITDFGDNTSKSEREEQVLAVVDSDDELLENTAETNTLLNELEADNTHNNTSTKNHPIREPIIFESSNKDELISLADTSPLKVKIYSVDEYYLERKLKTMLPDLNYNQLKDLENNILLYISNLDKLPKDDLEKKIFDNLDYENTSFLNTIINNRNEIFWGIKLARASEQNRAEILNDMRKNELSSLVSDYLKEDASQKKRKANSLEDEYEPQQHAKKIIIEKNSILNIIDIDKFKFNQEEKLFTKSKVSLPEGSFKRIQPHYEEIHIPPPSRPAIKFDLIPITELPEWAKKAFPSNESHTLNTIQSKIYPTAFNSDSNILLCAPTGAGKTNVAMLTVLRSMHHYFNEKTSTFNLNNFKAVFIAPLKALVQEQTREFQRRLLPYGIRVSELTGDSNLTTQEMEKSHILVSTPEKWDIITRKNAENSIYGKIDLVIIDEIHLLHDQRGPVIENIVARSLRGHYSTRIPRLVGLSATLPNYMDVAKFLRVPDEGIFFFDSSYRPCPLSQQFCSITEKSSIKKLHAQNIACYDKTLESLSEGHQVIVFVHSRKDTARTAAWLRDQFSKNDHMNKLRKDDASSKHILTTESENAQNRQLQDLLKDGVGIHHAGLSREDRSLSEDLFADGLLQVLVSTATLAWGVNLPAHTVIIKGTEVYSPQHGTWLPLSPQDILQMLGRAGRPRYDTYGEGIIITNQSEIQYYLSILNQQLPIESQLMSSILDSINAEVVSNTITSRKDAIEWLKRTYLYVRMSISPETYNILPQENEEFKNTLNSFCISLTHSALLLLHQQNLLIYNPDLDVVMPTELGRVASYFYIKHSSMLTYCKELNSNCSVSDLFRIFAMSDEFNYVSIKQEEQQEMKALLEKIPIPIQNDAEENIIKISVLLQTYISRFSFEGFAINSDMIFITQNAGRLFRAMYEICWRKGWAKQAKYLLDICRSVDTRMWPLNSPLRQFSKCPPEVVQRMEASSVHWKDYLSLSSPSEVGQAIRSEKHGKQVYDFLQRFPKLNIKCTLQPITCSLIKFDLEIMPNWLWDKKVHGAMEQFTIILEDDSGDTILYSTTVFIREELMDLEHNIDFTIQLPTAFQKKLPPNFFISVISEKWWQCSYQVPIMLKNFKLPKKFAAPRQLTATEQITTSLINDVSKSPIYEFTQFNRIVSEVYHSLYMTNESTIVCSSKGTGKQIMAELALLNHWRQNKGRAIFISPYIDKIEFLLKSWTKKFSLLAGGKVINKLGSNQTKNLRLLAESHLLFATPEQFDIISRRWRQRKNIQRIELLLYDDIQEIGNGYYGAIYECIISRMLFIATQLEKHIRFVCLGSCLANAMDIGQWLDIKKDNVYNFSPQMRDSPIDIHLQSFELNNIQFSPIMLEKAFITAQKYCEENNICSAIYLSTKRVCISILPDIVKFAQSSNWDLVKADEDDIAEYCLKIKDPQLISSIKNGIGLLYSGMNKQDQEIVEELYSYGALSLLLISKNFSHSTPPLKSIIILGTSYYSALEHRYLNYSVSEILDMIGSCSDNSVMNKALILTDNNMKLLYKKFISDAVPIESYLQFNYHNQLINDISNSIVRSKQDCVDLLTFSFFYRRIHANPSYYGFSDTSQLGISAFLTELVIGSLTDLQNCSFIELINEEPVNTDSESIIPLNGCLISCHYNVNFISMELFINSLKPSSTLSQILEILSRASEFEDMNVDEFDLSFLKKLSRKVPLSFSRSPNQDPVAFKVFILLQAYFSGIGLSKEYKTDLKAILKKCIPLINAIIDILSGDGYLNSMTAMELSQMLVQGVWDTDSPLKQIPHFNSEILQKCNQKNVETVYDIMALEDDERESIITLDTNKLIETANFINNYPNIELAYSIIGNSEIKIGELKQIEVTVNRDEEPDTLQANTNKLIEEKNETWWLILGEMESKDLYAIKKISLSEETQKYTLEFSIAEEGEHSLTLWCVCDSYLDADKEVSASVTVYA